MRKPTETFNDPVEAAIDLLGNPVSVINFFSYFELPAFADQRYTLAGGRTGFSLARQAGLLNAAALVARELGLPEQPYPGSPKGHTVWSVSLDANGKAVHPIDKTQPAMQGLTEIRYTTSSSKMDRVRTYFNGPDVSIRHLSGKTIVSRDDKTAFGQHWAHRVLRALPAALGR